MGRPCCNGCTYSETEWRPSSAITTDQETHLCDLNVTETRVTTDGSPVNLAGRSSPLNDGCLQVALDMNCDLNPGGGTQAIQANNAFGGWSRINGNWEILPADLLATPASVSLSVDFKVNYSNDVAANSITPPQEVFVDFDTDWGPLYNGSLYPSNFWQTPTTAVNPADPSDTITTYKSIRGAVTVEFHSNGSYSRHVDFSQGFGVSPGDATEIALRDTVNPYLQAALDAWTSHGRGVSLMIVPVLEQSGTLFYGTNYPIPANPLSNGWSRATWNLDLRDFSHIGAGKWTPVTKWNSQESVTTSRGYYEFRGVPVYPNFNSWRSPMDCEMTGDNFFLADSSIDLDLSGSGDPIFIGFGVFLSAPQSAWCRYQNLGVYSYGSGYSARRVPTYYVGEFRDVIGAPVLGVYDTPGIWDSQSGSASHYAIGTDTPDTYPYEFNLAATNLARLPAGATEYDFTLDPTTGFIDLRYSQVQRTILFDNACVKIVKV